ncbi:MAG TPA: DinB family protein [Streptosporangiaceae bacterium]|nr:DinB family protein [Streptosporangiaceae bacterium]
MEPCEECGFRPAAVSAAESPRLIRRLARRHGDWLTGMAATQSGDAAIRVRPRKGAWSPLEYTGHVRDVYALFDRRIQTVLKSPGSELEIIDHDMAVAEGGYNRLAATALADDLMLRADGLAATLRKVRPWQWSLRGFRGDESRTIEEIAKRAVHEGRHHLMDVERITASRAKSVLRPSS